MKTAAGVLLACFILPVAIFAEGSCDYTHLYETSSPAVVQVLTDTASGSGFLVTPMGHIATNFHVIRNARYLAVQFPNGRKVKAELAAVNHHYDMAILKVNSDAVDGVRPLPVLPEESDPSVEVGISVVAIGSPLNQKFLMTQGILSKVDDDTVMGDFLLQPGNSGGPLMNCSGEVVAINTFGEGDIGGAVRVDALRVFLSSPNLISESADVEPSADQLPTVSPVRYPIDALSQKVQAEPLDIEAYQVTAGDFTVTAITPVLIGKVHAAALKRAGNRDHQFPDTYQQVDEPYYEWHRSTETALDYAVVFDVRPQVEKQTSGWRKIPPFMLFGGRSEKQFKADFLELRIYRDGELIEPITPGREIIEASTTHKQGVADRAYAGSYTYSPDDFTTGNEFRVQIFDSRYPNAVYKEIVLPASSKFIKQLRSDFTLAPGKAAPKPPQLAKPSAPPSAQD